MRRNATHGIVLLAACGLVVWALRSGTLRTPGPGLAGDVAVTVVAAPPVEKNAPAPQQDPGANGYGSISGQVVFEGDIPVLHALVRAGDRNLKPEDRTTCATEDIPDENLVVDEKTRGIANVFVYLPKATCGIHPKLKKSKAPRVLTDIAGCRYSPHAVFARTDQVVVVRMADPITHNVHANTMRNKKPGEAIRPLDERRELEFEYARPESRPFAVACDLHTWMRAYWLILDHPYAAITDAKGRFIIADLPVGEYEFSVWHEVPGLLRADWKVTVKPNETTDLGTVRLPAEKFADAARQRR